ncbi:MAG: carboxypeptidase-like regulatory domain-containing protein, partial [Planctomycetota bacterium]
EKYSLSISAPDYLPAETLFLDPPESGETFDVGPIALTQTRNAGGVVVDASGSPIPDALVWSHGAPDRRRSGVERVEARTDAEGCFTLGEIHPQAAFALVEKEGYRMSGVPLLRDQPAVRVTLVAGDAPWPSAERIAPRKLDEESRRDAAKRLIEAMLPKRRNSSYFYGILLKALARIDTDAALAELDVATSASARVKVLAELGEFADALAEAESIDSAYSRAFARFGLMFDVDDVALKREILAAAVVDSTQIRRPDRRLVVVAKVAAELAELGDNEQAGKLLRGELADAKELSTTEWPGHARASFAERLALFEPETALAMVAEADEDDRTRHYRNLAHAVAATDPALAEQALGRIGNHRYVDEPAIRVAYRMAATDLPRALAVVERINSRRLPVAKANGLGAVAMAIFETDPDRAGELLQQAFEALPKQRGRSGYESDGIFGAAMTLLGYAEKIDPPRVADYYWQTLSQHPGPEGGAWSPADAAEKDAARQAMLALLIARYDGSPELTPQIV